MACGTTTNETVKYYSKKAKVSIWLNLSNYCYFRYLIIYYSVRLVYKRFFKVHFNQ